MKRQWNFWGFLECLGSFYDLLLFFTSNFWPVSKCTVKLREEKPHVIRICICGQPQLIHNDDIHKAPVSAMQDAHVAQCKIHLKCPHISQNAMLYLLVELAHVWPKLTQHSVMPRRLRNLYFADSVRPWTESLLTKRELFAFFLPVCFKGYFHFTTEKLFVQGPLSY